MSVSFCPEALRTIGHDLDWRGIRTFLIRCEGNLFVVDGWLSIASGCYSGHFALYVE